MGETLVLHECPFCHRPFEADLLAKEQIDSNELTKAGDFPIEGSATRRSLQILRGGLSPTSTSLILGLSDEEENAIAMDPEAYIVYKLMYKCKHCGKEWSKLSTEEKPLPREYVENQED